MDIDTLEQENRQLNARNARLMTEIAIMADFIRDLLHPEMYCHAVTPEIRDRARRVLGMAECETVAKPAVRDGSARYYTIEQERHEAERNYVAGAFDYGSAPIGSRDWCIYWAGWLARSTAVMQKDAK